MWSAAGYVIPPLQKRAFSWAKKCMHPSVKTHLVGIRSLVDFTVYLSTTRDGHGHCALIFLEGDKRACRADCARAPQETDLE